MWLFTRMGQQPPPRASLPHPTHHPLSAPRARNGAIAARLGNERSKQGCSTFAVAIHYPVKEWKGKITERGKVIHPVFQRVECKSASSAGQRFEGAAYMHAKKGPPQSDCIDLPSRKA
jgi:hypothetical protein